VQASKECAFKGLDTNLEEAIQLDEYLVVRLLQTEDIKEGVTALLEKPKSMFKGR